MNVVFIAIGGTLLLKTIFLIALLEKTELSNSFRDSGKIISFNAKQSKNARELIDSTPSGITMSERFKQNANADFPIVLRVFGSLIFLRSTAAKKF